MVKYIHKYPWVYEKESRAELLTFRGVGKIGKLLWHGRWAMGMGIGHGHWAWANGHWDWDGIGIGVALYL